MSGSTAARLGDRLLSTLAAARVADAAAFGAASTDLIALDRDGAGRVGLTQAAVLAALLEHRHPDGLTGDDARLVLERATRAGIVWWPALDANILLSVLAGALGVLDPDAEPYPATTLQLAQHAAILIADLLGPAEDPAPLVRSALAEIQRAQTIELP